MCLRVCTCLRVRCCECITGFLFSKLVNSYPFFFFLSFSSLFLFLGSSAFSAFFIFAVVLLVLSGVGRRGMG